LRNKINMMMTMTTAGMTGTNTVTAVGTALKLLLLLLHLLLLLLLLLLIQQLPLPLPYNIIFHRVSLIDASTAGLWYDFIAFWKTKYLQFLYSRGQWTVSGSVKMNNISRFRV
jgi:hypothetical protein